MDAKNDDRTAGEDLKPVFVVGSGRSGTTLLFRLLTGHPDFAWVSGLTHRIPWWPGLSVFSRLPGAHSLRPLRPSSESQGVYAWSQVPSLHPSRGSLTEQDMTETSRRRLRRIVRAHQRWMGCPSFVNKNTTNTMRIRYLHAIFPEARFVHLIRNGYGVVNSLLNVRFWPDLRLWWLGKTPREYEAEGGSQAELAARHWKRQVGEILDHKAHLPEAQYLEVRYEDVLENTHAVLNRIMAFAEMRESPRFWRHVERIGVRPGRKDRWQEELDREAQARVEAAAGDLLEELGYGRMGGA